MPPPVRRRFFVDRFENGGARLAGGAAEHLARVLRAEEGELYELSDGREVFLARIARVGRGAVDFTLAEPVPVPASRLRITLLLAVVKFDRLEWALEKATELGADVVIPVAAERSTKALVAAAGKRAARWSAILLESAQQARCLRPPELRPLVKPAEAFRAAKGGLRLLLSERPGAPRLRTIVEGHATSATSAADPIDVSLAVGPEGGWTDSEFAGAASAGFREVSLGDRILRTETAVAAGLAALHVYFDS